MKNDRSYNCDPFTGVQLPIANFLAICSAPALEMLKRIPPDITIEKILSASLERVSLSEEPPQGVPLEDLGTDAFDLNSELPILKSSGTDAIDEFDTHPSFEVFLDGIKSIGHLWYWQQVDMLEHLLKHPNNKYGDAITVSIHEDGELLRIVARDTGEVLLELYSTEDVREAKARLGKDFFHDEVFMDYGVSTPTVILSTRYGLVDPNVERAKLKYPRHTKEYDRLSKLPKHLLNHMLREQYDEPNVESGLSHRAHGDSLFLSYEGADLVSFKTSNQSWLKKSTRKREDAFHSHRKQRIKNAVERAYDCRTLQGGFGRPPERPMIQVSYYEVLRFVDNHPGIMGGDKARRFD
jgi:hypothetical protein